jgi:hypothetical protein
LIRGVCIALGLASVAAAAAPAPAADPERPRAAGGVRLVEALETAPATVVGHVLAPRSLDRSGRAAKLRVETPIRGPLEAGTTVQIAWEELSPGRAPRFADGDRVLVSLERLPDASIWLARIPEPGEREKTLGVAMRGDAFLRDPSLGTANLLLHYAALTDGDREGPQGVGYLAELAFGAEVPLALDAVRRLARRSALDQKFGPGAGRRLVQALVRPDATADLEDAIVELIATRKLESTRAALEALAGAESLPPPIVFAALARLDEGLSPERTAKLLERAPPRYREVAARYATGPGVDRTLERLVLRDPEPEVRIRAIERLAQLRGEQAVDPLVDALGDPENSVRGAAARQLGALGAPTVPVLGQVARGNDPEAARAALVGLALNESGEARTELVEIADTHPDPAMRLLADVALGRPIGHRD